MIRSLQIISLIKEKILFTHQLILSQHNPFLHLRKISILCNRQLLINAKPLNKRSLKNRKDLNLDNQGKVQIAEALMIDLTLDDSHLEP